MKRLFTFVFIACFLTLSLFANSFTDAGFHFSIKPLYSYEFGVLDEFVFAKEDSANEYKLSELNWTVKNHSMGLSADFGWKWISIDTAFSFGFSGKSGNMYDSDWQDPFNHSIKTNYSINENKLNKSCSFEIGISGDIPFTPESISNIFSASFIQSIKYAYKYYDFSGSNGEGWYGTKEHTYLSYDVPFDSEEAMHYTKGQLFSIDYKREHQNCFIGEGINLRFLNRVELLLNYDICIYSSIVSIDTHYNNKENTTGKDFLDKMSDNLLSGRFYSELDYKFWKNLHIGVGYLYTWQNLIKGTTHFKYHQLSSYSLDSESSSGSSAKTHTINFFIQYSIDDSHFIY